jgi:hypothetical protein
LSKWLQILALALGLSLLAVGQSDRLSDRPNQGTNYDPPPVPRPEAKPTPPIPEEPEEPEKPLFDLPNIDWGARDTWVKLALLAGSIALARRAFNDMSD